MHDHEQSINFYETNYEIIGQWLVRPRDKVILGDMNNRTCRFCGKTHPEVSFKKVAHAIPELLGNKSIASAYECDICNKEFGDGIENDLGNWSKPMRTLIRIKGKKSVPTLKKGGDKPGWRIEYGQDRLNIRAYENDPIFEVDEDNKTVIFKLRRDSYTPVAVLKAFMKIGVTLLPDNEVPNFLGLMAWIKESDHSKAYLNKCPVIYSFQPGPLPSDLISALILRRKNAVTGYPYAFLVIGYGNEVFQVSLPSEIQDGKMSGQSISIRPFPVPGNSNPAIYGETKSTVLDWMDFHVRKGEIMTMEMSYDTRVPVEITSAD
ncbi:hypothetical protein I6F40_19580 [Pseudoalteromonas sp. SWXJ133]|nr:hypothetical protein [Pseudoalteromonas sp. SWXJ133]